jgi:protoheme IX farnesyltransferase
MTNTFTSKKVNTYISLTKPGIIKGNILATLAGYFFAAQGHVTLKPLIGVVLGTSFIIAAGCVYNNVIDRFIDAKMSRTKQRALVVGSINIQHALVFGSVLLSLGFFLLGTLTNVLTILIGLIGFIDYVVLYSIFKRASVHGTVVGSVSGAVPPVAGYCALTGRLDGAALLLFLLMTFWQMPHFYAIALRRMQDYKAAKLPVLPLVKGVTQTKAQIVLYIFGFVLITQSMTILGYTSYVFMILELLLGGVWLYRAWDGFDDANYTKWATRLFNFSLIILTATCGLLSVDFLFH